MQNMWISVVLIVLVIVLGLVAGARLSTPGPQRRAIYSAFGTLAVLAIWFFVFIAFFPGDWIVPFFTVACIVVPICIYVGVSRGSHSARGKQMKIPKAKSVDTIKAAQPQGPKPPTPDQVAAKAGKPTFAPASAQGVQPISTPAQGAKPAPTATATATSTTTTPTNKAAAQTPVQQPQKTAAPAQPKPMEQPEPAEQKQEAPAIPTAKKPADKPTEQAPAAKTEPKEALERADEKAAKPTAAEAAPETKSVPEHPLKEFSDAASADRSELAPTPVPANASAADLDILVNKAVAEEIDELEELIHPFGAPKAEPVDQGPELNIGSPVDSSSEQPGSTARPESPTETDATSAAAAAQPASTTPEPAKTPEPPKPVKKTEPADPFTEFCKKATTLRDQGSYAVAALLFEKAAAIAPSANAKRDTQFDELSCYVKAGDSKKAKALAASLRQSSVLTRFERIKLDAVERMS